MRQLVVFVDHGQVLMQQAVIFVLADQVLQSLIAGQVVFNPVRQLVIGLVNLELDLAQGVQLVVLVHHELIVQAEL